MPCSPPGAPGPHPDFGPGGVQVLDQCRAQEVLPPRGRRQGARARRVCIFMCVYLCVYAYLSLYIYIIYNIYIYIERERERKISHSYLCVCIYLSIYLSIYIYIYIYIFYTHTYICARVHVRIRRGLASGEVDRPAAPRAGLGGAQQPGQRARLIENVIV